MRCFVQSLDRAFMQRVIGGTLSIFCVLCSVSLYADGASFDCNKATRQIDKAICAWDTVGSLDGKMATRYKAVLAAQQGEAAIAAVKTSQKAWLAERDKRCGLDQVKPREGSEEELSPKEYGQLLCLQAIYPARIAQLMDMAAPPLTPQSVKVIPTAPLQAAYPDHWQQMNYQALFSPDKTLMALGVEDGGYVVQIWLHQLASGQLVLATPRVHQGRIEQAQDISEFNHWSWSEDGHFQVRARRPLGEDTVFNADMNGYTEQPATVPASELAANAEAEAMKIPSPLPDFDDYSRDPQTGGGLTVWLQNRGHGSLALLAARVGDKASRLVAEGNWELEHFVLDPTGTRLFYNGEDGLMVTDPTTGITRRLKGTRGTSLEVQPLALSQDGEVLAYWSSGSCTNDAATEVDPDTEQDSVRQVCLAYLPPAAAVATAPASPWEGEWASEDKALTASVRRESPQSDKLVIDFAVGIEGCAGAVTLHGVPSGSELVGEGGDPEDTTAPVCRVDLSLDKDTLKSEVAGPCSYYHGAACDFSGTMVRGH